jgi:cell division protein FtsW
LAEIYDFPYNKFNNDAAVSKPEERLNDYTRETRLNKRGRMDLPFFLLTMLILVTGLIMLLSASYARSYYETYDPATGSAAPLTYFIRQVIFSVIGTTGMLVMSRIKIGIIRKYSVWLMIISIGLLFFVLLKGITGGGAERWINLFGITQLQPSEIAKLAVILTFSAWICKYGERMKTFKYGVLPFAATLAIISFLLLLQPHLSATIIILALGAMMMFAGGTRFYWFTIVIAAGWLAAKFVTNNREWLSQAIGAFEYAFERIDAWKNPEAALLEGGWQIMQSLYAVGSGGLLGLGLGQSRQKYLYLPEEHNDYIFSIVCEELGFVGATLILLLFAVLIIRGFWLAMHCRDKYSSLVVTGIMILLTLQVFLNVAVATNLMPSTGISLPFFSYGGSALCIQMAEMGIVLSVSKDIPEK